MFFFAFFVAWVLMLAVYNLLPHSYSTVSVTLSSLYIQTTVVGLTTTEENVLVCHK